MLTEAHVGFLFRAPDNVKREFAQFKAVETYEELMKLAKAPMGRPWASPPSYRGRATGTSAERNEVAGLG